jgi:uncharacterized protein (UPF0332 family)
VRNEFARLAAADDRLGSDLGRFLGRAYRLKDLADYAPAPAITAAEAEAAIAEADRLVAAVGKVLRDT